MGKLFFSLCAALPLAAFALISGEKAEMVQLDYVKNGPVYFDEYSYRGKEPFAHLRIVTTFATFIPGSASQLLMLDSLEQKYRDFDLKSVAFSPEPKQALINFTAALPLLSSSIGCDSEGKATNHFLDGAMVASRSFIVDAAREIIWDGDPDDLPRVLDAIYNGNFNPSGFRSISTWQQDLTLAVAGGNVKEIGAIADRILRIDPNNSMALRGYLYAADTTQTPEEIFSYFSKLKNANPNNLKLYQVLFSQCQKSPVLTELAWPLADEFATRFFSDSNAINQIAWGLLNSFSMNPGALRSSAKFVAILEKAPPTAEILTTCALYYSRIGKLQKALELQQQALLISPPEDMSILTSFEVFYKTGLELSK